MNKMPLKYQIGLFGNFDSIQQTPDIVKNLMDVMQKFDSYNLLLNTMTEITFDPQIGTPVQVNRISFNDQNSGLQIMFGSKRLDFIKEMRDENGNNMGELGDFTKQIEKIILALSNSFDEIKKFNRLALISESFINKLTEAEKDKMYKKLLNEIFFQNQSIKEWNVRIADKQGGVKLQEQINTILSIDRIQGQLIVNNQQKNIDEIKLLLDINTIAEDTSLRFDIDSINKFLEDSVNKVTLTFNDIEQKLLAD